ncbi:MAG TPA: CRISPR-associated helicase Cas3' [Clostridiales bacterium]|nr:CRISPR-associated helicase Cas3' [Clostridiales bacterium]
MIKLSRAAESVWAKKSSKNGNLLWLPLIAHMADSAMVARRLWNHWLPNGVRDTISTGIMGKGKIDPLQLFVFLAAVHDLGKATPVFQAKKTFPLSRELDERIEENIVMSGLPMRPLNEFTNANRTPHALATQVLLMDAGCPGNAPAILGSHHGKPPELPSLYKYGMNINPFNYHLEDMGKQPWTAVQSELIHYALALSDISDIKDIPNLDLKSQVLLTGLLIMTDWIASNERYFPYIRLEDQPEALDYKSRIGDAWEELSLPYPWEPGNIWMFTPLYKQRFGFNTPNNMQTAVEEVARDVVSPGILVLEAPMGSGKTEAALACAEIFADKTGRSGVFFALPTQATSDGVLPRVIDWIDMLETEDQHTIELAHGKAQFNDEFQSLKYLEGSTNIESDDIGAAFVHEWFEGQKRALLADFVVGTIDQLLLAALKQKHVMLRHLGLAGKVVIIDECHAYDAYMGQYLKRALNWLGAYKVPVIVLSATLPAQTRQMVIDAYLNRDSERQTIRDPLGRSKSIPNPKIEGWVENRDYPLITCTDGNRIIQKTAPVELDSLRKINIGFLSEEDLVSRLEDLLSEGGCAGIIVNTVKRAQELAQVLIQVFGSDTVRLLHSQFLATDRTKKEDQLRKELGKPRQGTKRPHERIVIGTQVLEQSLDIDFDLLITDICPMDLLLQRIGRLHRHRRPRPEKLESPLCLIMGIRDNDFDDGAVAIYGQYLLMRTKAMLPKVIELPTDIPQLVQDVYDDRLKLAPEPQGYSEAKAKHEMEIEDKKERANTFQITKPWSGPSYNLLGWLDTDIRDQRGEAAVRDTYESIEVLLIQRRRDGRMYFLPWQEGGQEIPVGEVPNNQLAKALARQRINLPRVLCTPWMIDKTIAQLEDFNSRYFSSWQESTWLKGELFLVLDESYTASLCDYRLHYHRTLGLIYEKEA